MDEARKWLGRGKDVAAAGRMAGLFSDLEADLLHAALSAGSPALTYFRLAERYTLKARLSRQMRSKLLLPIVVFVLVYLYGRWKRRSGKVLFNGLRGRG
ncbi:type II secretion system F family protein [Iodobacter ciconiae]|uniref:type II secretion system F family protein n=1 Tax=Iodobacter ciconiae TaxID=2496266 RepID=UPI0013DF58CE|nr:type II secretion system F family protein [Iodobacter ciconiae]